MIVPIQTTQSLVSSAGVLPALHEDSSAKHLYRMLFARELLVGIIGMIFFTVITVGLCWKSDAFYSYYVDEIFQIRRKITLLNSDDYGYVPQLQAIIEYLQCNNIFPESLNTLSSLNFTTLSKEEVFDLFAIKNWDVGELCYQQEYILNGALLNPILDKIPVETTGYFIHSEPGLLVELDLKKIKEETWNKLITNCFIEYITSTYEYALGALYAEHLFMKLKAVDNPGAQIFLNHFTEATQARRAEIYDKMENILQIEAHTFVDMSKDAKMKVLKEFMQKNHPDRFTGIPANELKEINDNFMYCNEFKQCLETI